MRMSQKRTCSDMSYIPNERFQSSCRICTKHFTRKRKMPLIDLLYSMINRRGTTLSIELRDFMKTAHPGLEISKPGYLKQRMKLNPEAFVELYHYHNKNFYSVPGFSTFHNYLVLAADGSAINIPTTKETLNWYGSTSRRDTKPQAQIGLSCIYDVLNRMILESSCNKCKFDEMRVAEKQLLQIPETIGKNQPFILLMDRGYPSTPALLHLMKKNISFVVRLKSSFYKKEQEAMTREDSQVKIVLDETRIRRHRGTEDEKEMRQCGEITLRMVKIHLKDKTEVLLTNLAEEKFQTEEIRELYHMRWGIETAYELLKTRLEIENFTGKKPILLEQDINSTIYISNLAEDIIRDAQEEYDKKEGNGTYKMAVNQTVGIGILKSDLIYILLEPDHQKQEILFNNIYESISKHVEPIRPDRHYKRTKGRLAGKYSTTHKRAY